MGEGWGGGVGTSIDTLKGIVKWEIFFRRGTSKKKILLGTFLGSVLTIFISFSGSIIFFSGLVIDIPDSYTKNYPKKSGFNLYQSRHCACITYSVKTWFLKNLYVCDSSFVIGFAYHQSKTAD